MLFQNKVIQLPPLDYEDLLAPCHFNIILLLLLWYKFIFILYNFLFNQNDISMMYFVSFTHEWKSLYLCFYRNHVLNWMPKLTKEKYLICFSDKKVHFYTVILLYNQFLDQNFILWLSKTLQDCSAAGVTVFHSIHNF